MKQRCRLLGLCLMVLSCGIELAQASDPPAVPPMTPQQLTLAIASSDIFYGRQALHNGKANDKALAFFQAGAARGNPVAQSYLGYLTYMGQGVEQNDVVAADWFRKAAAQGYEEAQVRLGLMHTHPRVLAKAEHSLAPDLKEAGLWLRLAAEQGSAVALNEVGLLVLRDTSLPDRVAAARSYFQRGFRQGSGESAQHMCETYHPAPTGPATPTEAGSQDAARWCDLARINLPLVMPDDTPEGRLVSNRLARSTASHE